MVVEREGVAPIAMFLYEKLWEFLIIFDSLESFKLLIQTFPADRRKGFSVVLGTGSPDPPSFYTLADNISDKVQHE